MSYTTSEMTPADFAAVCGNNNGGGWGFGGDGAWWIIILLLFGWGGRGFGYGGNGVGGGGGIPATQADVRAAVDQQTLISKLDQQTYGLADATYALNNTITNGFHGVDRGLCDLSRQLADCCCENRAAIADVKYTIANEGCETRHALFNNTRDIIDNANANSRAILDFLTKDKIDTLMAENQSLRLSASQANQNAVLMAAMDANTATILRRTGAECPTAAYLVQPPTPVNFPVNGCGQVQFGNYGNNGCGCGGF